jgi:hypothetical protein
MKRRALLGSMVLLTPLSAVASIFEPPVASRAVRHRFTWSQLSLLAGHKITVEGARTALRAAFVRLLDRRVHLFMTGLVEQEPMVRVGDAIVGRGWSADSLGDRGSWFVLARGGAMFAVIRSGDHGEQIEQFGDARVLKDRALHHHYLEFTDLDE